jgi:hypothetical protein
MDRAQVLDKMFDYADLFASEYGWSLEYSMALKRDVTLKLLKKIQQRKNDEYSILVKLIAIAVNCGFSGKMKPLDKLFTNDEEGNDPEEFDTSIREMMRGLGKTEEEIDQQLKEGNVTL